MTSTIASPTVLSTALVRHDSPLGRLEIHTRGPVVTRLDIETDGHLPCEHLTERSTEFHDEIRRQLDDYFARRRRAFDLPISATGTGFQHEVWDALGAVAWGTATTYGDLAARTGRPTGARAVGGAIRANPIALLVPCHRVLGSARRVTGYSAGNGVTTKKWLLAHEGIDFTP